MVKLNRIYTRTGDNGTTGLVGGSRVRKTDLRVQAYGEIDEVNSHIGTCWTLARDLGRIGLIDKLAVIQNELFDIGAELATPPGAAIPGTIITSSALVLRLEEWIDELNDALPELRSFVLPGGTLLNSALHIARAVTRRAERSILALSEHEAVSSEVIHYVNRLSDLLFVMSRHESAQADAAEHLWVPGGSRAVK